jgi:hypothetical protein
MANIAPKALHILYYSPNAHSSSNYETPNGIITVSGVVDYDPALGLNLSKYGVEIEDVKVLDVFPYDAIEWISRADVLFSLPDGLTANDGTKAKWKIVDGEIMGPYY